MNNDFDLAIALRVYPGISKQPIGNFASKYDLFKVSLLSLIESLHGVNAMFYVILDGCDDTYDVLLSSHIASEKLIVEKTDKVGNAATFLLQINWLLTQQFSNRIYFAEDDYLYRAGMFHKMLDILDNQNFKVHFVTPHNHGDYYRHIVHQVAGTRMAFINGLQCHLPISTCLTFLTTKEVLSKTRKVFESYQAGNYDFCMFAVLVRPGLLRFPPFSLWGSRYFQKCVAKAWLHTFAKLFSKDKYYLAVAIDPVGTHMQFDEVGPGVNWEQVIARYQNG